MRTITEMAVEASKVAAKANYCELILEMESKLALIQHAISENPRHLERLGFTGISFLVSDIQRGLNQIESLCEKVEDYFYFLNNPGFMVEINQAEKHAAEVRKSQM